MKTINKLRVLGCIAILSGCSMNSQPSNAGSTRTVYREVAIEAPAQPVPGVVEYVWEEPMIDVIDVPPGLDPEGHYYRRGHQSVVEVRQGRWRHYDSKN